MTAESFGQVLRRLRTEAGLSQNALARAAGIDPAYVNRFEKGAQLHPARMVVLALARALGLGEGRTDRLLFAAGLAPQQDWQSRALVAEGKLAAIQALLLQPEEPIALVRRTG